MARARVAGAPDVESAAAWTLRRVGFGATVDDLERATSIGLSAFLDELFEPDATGATGRSPQPAPLREGRG
ncbi:MAG: hypothetical protein O6853_04730 [Actinobacteria bacterium]|nr:hypothetical protein [Actinomycetota bacterium]